MSFLFSFISISMVIINLQILMKRNNSELQLYNLGLFFLLNNLLSSSKYLLFHFFFFHSFIYETLQCKRVYKIKTCESYLGIQHCVPNGNKMPIRFSDVPYSL